MTETISSNSNFNMPVDELLEFALESLGGEHTSHKEARLARTALNLIFIDIQNEGTAPLASLKLSEKTLVSGSSEEYLLSANVINIMDGVLSTSVASGKRTDTPLNRLSYSEWLRIPNKDSTGKPSHFFVNKQRENVKVSFWPKPNNSSYSFKAWTVKRIANVDRSYQLVDLPHIYLPTIVSGLHYYMAKLRSKPLDEVLALKNEYMVLLDKVLSEDRERVSLQIYPSNKGQLGS